MKSETRNVINQKPKSQKNQNPKGNVPKPNSQENKKSETHKKAKIFKINTPLPPPTKNAKLTKTLNHTDRKTEI